MTLYHLSSGPFPLYMQLQYKHLGTLQAWKVQKPRKEKLQKKIIKYVKQNKRISYDIW